LSDERTTRESDNAARRAELGYLSALDSLAIAHPSRC